MKTVNVTQKYRDGFAGLILMNCETIHEFTPQSFIDASLRMDIADDEEFIYPIIKVKQWNNGEVVKFKEQLQKDIQITKEQMIKDVHLKECIENGEPIPKYKKSKVVDKKTIIIGLVKTVVDGWEYVYGNGDEIEYDGYKSLEIFSEDVLEDILKEVAFISGVNNG